MAFLWESQSLKCLMALCRHTSGIFGMQWWLVTRCKTVQNYVYEHIVLLKSHWTEPFFFQRLITEAMLLAALDDRAAIKIYTHLWLGVVSQENCDQWICSKLQTTGLSSHWLGN